MSAYMGELIKSFETRLNIKGLSENTILNYVSDLNELHNWLKLNRAEENIEIESVTYDDLELFACYLANKKNKKINAKTQEKTYVKTAKNTLSRKITSIKEFYKYIVFKGIVNKDASAILDNSELTKGRNSSPKYLSREDCQNLFNAIPKDNKRDAAIIKLFLYTGLRLSELTSLTINDIYRAGKILEEIKVIGKGNKERDIPINQQAKTALEEWLSVRCDIPNIDSLFTSSHEQGISARQIQNLIKKYLVLIDRADYSVHKLRHTFASNAYKNGAGIRELQEVMGHGNISTTEIYTHIDDTQRKTVTDAVNFDIE